MDNIDPLTRVTTRGMSLVVITSKLCNLRCRYCYEFPFLADKKRVALDDLKRLFLNVRAGLDAIETPVPLRFQWHGGEPLLIPPSYYHAAIDLQRSVFEGSPHHITNVVQSNFTVLDEDRITLLRDVFDVVGVSLDLHSGLRVDTRGRCQERRAIENLDRALAQGVTVGGISVLTRRNLDWIAEIYEFYKSRGMSFRLLPLERGPYPDGQSIELDPSSTLQAFRTLTDLWFADGAVIGIEPLLENVRFLVQARANPNQLVVHDKLEWEPVLIADPTGRVFSFTHEQTDEHAIGNIFRQPLDHVLASQAHRRLAEAAQARMRSTCSRCPFFGRGCTGYAIAENSVSFEPVLADGSYRCTVQRGLLDYLESKLILSGAILAESGRPAQAFQPDNEAAHVV